MYYEDFGNQRYSPLLWQHAKMMLLLYSYMYTLHKKYINYEKTEITNNSNMLCFTT